MCMGKANVFMKHFEITEITVTLAAIGIYGRSEKKVNGRRHAVIPGAVEPRQGGSWEALHLGSVAQASVQVTLATVFVTLERKHAVMGHARPDDGRWRLRSSGCPVQGWQSRTYKWNLTAGAGNQPTPLSRSLVKRSDGIGSTLPSRS